MTKLAPYWKAIIAFVAPALVLLLAAVDKASDGGSRITTTEWIYAVIACFATSAGVFTVPNKRVR